MTVIQNQSEDEQAPQDLQRKLSNRHLQLIAIGGAIGTGLFMGSGKTISLQAHLFCSFI
jgi:D-serine/D-alanine/glycine transporter